MQRSKLRLQSLLNNLVGAGKQRGRDSVAEHDLQATRP